jgi:hypothetical protein
VLGIDKHLSGAFAEALESHRKALADIAHGAGSSRARSLILTEIGLNQLELEELELATGSLNEALKIPGALQRRPVPERADLLVGLGRPARTEAAGRSAPFLEEANGFWLSSDSRLVGLGGLPVR